MKQIISPNILVAKKGNLQTIMCKSVDEVKTHCFPSKTALNRFNQQYIATLPNFSQKPQVQVAIENNKVQQAIKLYQ